MSRDSLPALLVALALSVTSVHAQAPAPATSAIPQHLVWSDEFNTPGPPNPANWKFETGGGGWGNGELETYCSLVTTDAPCKPATEPNAFVGQDGSLHIVARRSASGDWTSARLLTRGLHSFGYGRIEARIRIPAGQGVWPAFWMLGDDIGEHPWPACGELDIMENIGRLPAQINGSVHGVGFTGTPLTTVEKNAAGEPIAAAFHTFGMLWSPGKVQYYMDDPTRPYATYTPADLPKGAIWPFDNGRYFVTVNLAIGGQWPGAPDASTPSPAEMLVDYVRVYQAEPKQP